MERREFIIDLHSLGMKAYNDESTQTKVYYTYHDSLTQTFCFRRVMRDLGYRITATHMYYEDEYYEDDEVVEKHFHTNISIQDGDNMFNIYNDYIDSNEIDFFISSRSSSCNSSISSPSEIEPQNDD